MNESVAKQRVNEFHRRHGESYLMDGNYYFADGARREAGGDITFCLMVEPPSLQSSGTPERLEYDLSVAKLKYHQAKLQAALQNYNDFRQKLECSLPVDEDAAVAKLKELGAIAQQARKEFDKAQRAVNTTSIGKVRKLVEQDRHKESVRINNWKNKLHSVKI